MNECKVTVIVPIYNSEKFLLRCLESILRQTMKEIQVILVNDGSTDDSKQIIDSFSFIDNRILVLDQENQGPSEARNRALQHSVGDYIAFVDSDDMIEVDMLEKMHASALREDADIVVCQFRKFDDKGTLFVTRDFQLEDLSSLIASRTYSLMCNKLIKRGLFAEYKIQFPAGIYYEDIATLYRLYFFATKIISLDDVYYHWYQRDHSRTESLDTKHIDDMFTVFGLMKSFLLEVDVLGEYQQDLLERCVRGILYLFDRIDHLVEHYENKHRFWKLLYAKIDRCDCLSEKTLQMLSGNHSQLYHQLLFRLQSRPIYTQWSAERIIRTIEDLHVLGDDERARLYDYNQAKNLDMLMSYRKQLYILNSDELAKYEFSKNINAMFYSIDSLKRAGKKIAIYGNGVIGNIVAQELGKQVVAIVDIVIDSRSEYAPVCRLQSLHDFDVEQVVICVFGREQEIRQKILDEFGTALEIVNISYK